MDPHSFIARAEAQRWLGIAEKLLMGHDLVGSKTFAIRARESDPRLEAADQILAITDTLLAAEKRVVGNNGTQQPDFYAILQLVRFVQDTEHIASQYRRLAVLLNPHQNRFPYSDQAFQLVNDAWAVLSNPLRKSMYDSELDFSPQQQMNHIGFNLEQHHHQQQHHHHHQQQHQHNFFSLNHMGSGHEQELAEPAQTFQTRVQRSHQQQQLQQHNFLSQPNPVRPVPVREQEQLFQQRDPQVQPFQITSTPQQQSRPPPQPPQPQPPMRPPTPPPAAPPQPPLSWPQAPPPSQPQPQPQTQTQPPQAQPHPKPQQQPLQPQPPQAQPHPHPHPQPQQQPLQPQPLQAQPHPQPQQLPPLKPQLQPQPQPQLQKKQLHQQLQQEQQQQEQQQEPLEQKATPFQLPSQVNSNNGVTEEEIERQTEAASENVDESPTFWTACPYCLYMYEYPRVYAECTLRCDNCKRAFQAVPIPSPPPIIEGQETYFCCWGFFPLGVSMSHLEKNNDSHTNTSWTPFSPMYDISSNVQDHLNGKVAKKNKSWGPCIYIDDVTDDIFTGISEPSDGSDVEWDGTERKKVKRMKKDLGNKRRAKVLGVGAKEVRNRMGKNLQSSIPVQEEVGELTVPLAESNNKAVASNLRRQSGRVAKELGKLDLNVEFNNNEGEEPAPRVAAGDRGHGQGEEDNIEGIGFFEGLDEFLSSLPILSVVNDDKVKAA